MKRMFILVLILIMILSNLALASNKNFGFISDLGEAGKRAANEPIKIYHDDDNSFEEISYVISSTGAASGIRYRTSEIRIVVGNDVYRLDTLELQNLVPKTGQTVHSLITISAQNIIDGMNEERKRNGLSLMNEAEISNIKNSLNDPSKIEIEATIDIYNKGTGKVLDRIRDINDISKIAGKYGFSTKHMNDMESRFRNKPVNRIITEPEKGEDTHTKKGGLRPTIIRH